MRCTFPRSAGFDSAGRITFSHKSFARSMGEAFQVPCGKCLECRLEYARTWAIRCVHEASMHDENCFITLTYSDENLKSTKLIYEDFQKFMKRLRRSLNHPIGVFVTGEYGEKTKRPHWHAILFGYRPSDAKRLRRNERGDEIFTSESLSRLWGQGQTEFGSVTLESAGYCARYAAKKLVHGRDQDHDLHPISKRSSRYAIGKAWLEKNFSFVVEHGFVNVRKADGRIQSAPVPRYYEKWLQLNKPELWLRYVTGAKAKKCKEGEIRSQREFLGQLNERVSRSQRGEYAHQMTPNQVRDFITKAKFKQLQQHLKL